MLIPVLVRSSYRISGATTVTLESLLGNNLPLLFPEVVVMNRTATTCSVSVAYDRRVLFTNQPDSSFNGAVVTALSTVALGEDTESTLGLVPNSLLPTARGVTHELTITNSGPAGEAWVTIMVKGLIESAVSPDPLVTINV